MDYKDTGARDVVLMSQGQTVCTVYQLVCVVSRICDYLSLFSDKDTHSVVVTDINKDGDTSSHAVIWS